LTLLGVTLNTKEQTDFEDSIDTWQKTLKLDRPFFKEL